MMSLPLFLKIISPVFVLVGIMHLVFGANSEVMLGAVLSESSLADPVLDSQNRFYGIAFTVFGFLWYLCAGDLTRFEPVAKILIWVFFAAGCARLVSVYVYGLPSIWVQFLLASELFLPPILHLLLRIHLTATQQVE